MVPATLLLDFDGVAHRDGIRALDQHHRLVNDPDLFKWLPALAGLLHGGPSVQLVVSSDWGALLDDEALTRLLGPVGRLYAGVMDRVPRATRAASIEQYAAKNGLRRWLALDDDPSVQKAAARNRHLVWCNPQLGLSEKRVQASVARWLKAR